MVCCHPYFYSLSLSTLFQIFLPTSISIKTFTHRFVTQPRLWLCFSIFFAPNISLTSSIASVKTNWQVEIIFVLKISVSQLDQASNWSNHLQIYKLLLHLPLYHHHHHLHHHHHHRRRFLLLNLQHSSAPPGPDQWIPVGDGPVHI